MPLSHKRVTCLVARFALLHEFCPSATANDGARVGQYVAGVGGSGFAREHVVAAHAPSGGERVFYEPRFIQSNNGFIGKIQMIPATA